MVYLREENADCEQKRNLASVTDQWNTEVFNRPEKSDAMSTRPGGLFAHFARGKTYSDPLSRS